jgi:hypothetical protein
MADLKYMLFANSRLMHVAVAEAWVTAHGNNDTDDVHDAFASTTDAELADECWKGWGLGGERDEDSAPSSLFYMDELTEAFAEVRETYAKKAASALKAEDLVVVRSDTGDGGWSLHTPQAIADAKAQDDLPLVLTYGEAAWDEATETWSRPNAEDYAKALKIANE